MFKRDLRKKVDPKDYSIENKNSETFVKMPGTINGMQFIIQNLEVNAILGCSLYLDYLTRISFIH